eukprot:scaffold958_cov128-Skeletonema_dohrnii-CCMP3373.AAC.4
MVTVIHFTPSEAAAIAATTASPSAVDAAINAPTQQIRGHPSCTDRAQHPKDAATGERLCDGHDNKADRGEKKRALPSEDSISGKDDMKKRQRVNSFNIDLSDAPAQTQIAKSGGRIGREGSKYTGVFFCKQMNKWMAKVMIEGDSKYIGCYENEEDAAIDYARAEVKCKGQRALDKARAQNSLAIDLSDVPPQQPILKNTGRIKQGASKYTGVSFSKQKNKWIAQITIDGKRRCIGCYENEEEAAVDYARALFKYKGQGALDKARTQSSLAFDLSDVPPQQPILKNTGRIKEGASKYTGVSFDKQKNKWTAQITIDGKQRRIGYYENEEEAAVDYARAVFKYKGQEALDKVRAQSSLAFDLTDVPLQSPILRSHVRIGRGGSKYVGVSCDKRDNKWQAQIMIDGEKRSIGYYDNEEEAAADYARAVFKHKGQEALDKVRETNSFAFDLTDVPPQLPIPKSGRNIIDGASKYIGVSLDKRDNKWHARITIDGKLRSIGCYENEEEAAVDYARAVFKYRGQEAIDKLRAQSPLAFDLTDVPQQSPISKSGGRIGRGVSKYTGVSFDKWKNKWIAQIRIEGKQRRIGYYDDEEEAAVDYARAVFKHRFKCGRETGTIQLSKWNVFNETNG